MYYLQQILLFVQSLFLALMPLSTYKEGVVGQPQSFLPHQAQSQSDQTISKLIYRGLFKYDIYGNLIPDLAESWEISGDGLVYTIKLKPDQYWSDGQKITSDDLIYTAFKVGDLQGVATDKVDNVTVRYTLPNEFSPFLNLMTVGVMQANSEENYNALTPVSSGPFKVLKLQRSGPVIREVVLINTALDSKIQKIVFRYYTNEEELTIAAKLGEIDAFLSYEEHDLENFINHKFPLQGVYFALFFNLENEKLKDVTARQNLQKTLDIENVIYKYGIFVQGSISRSPFTDNDLKFNKYDETFNTDLESLELTLTIPDLPQHREIADMLKRTWNDKLNVDLEIHRVDPVIFVKEVVESRNYEVLLYGQETSRDPDRYINWHSTQKQNPGLNLSLFEHVRADRSLEEGRREVDNPNRIVHYDEFQKVFDEQVPAIFLYHPHRNFYVTKYIEGVGEKYTFTVSDRFLDFENWRFVVTN